MLLFSSFRKFLEGAEKKDWWTIIYCTNSDGTKKILLILGKLKIFFKKDEINTWSIR